MALFLDVTVFDNSSHSPNGKVIKCFYLKCEIIYEKYNAVQPRKSNENAI